MTNIEIKKKLRTDLNAYANKHRVAKDLSKMTGYSRSWIYRYWHSYNAHERIESAAIELLKQYKAEAKERVTAIEQV